jgi:hypothetical protein
MLNKYTRKRKIKEFKQWCFGWYIWTLMVYLRARSRLFDIDPKTGKYRGNNKILKILLK